MSQVRSTLSMVLAFATRLAPMLLGAVIAIALFHGDGDTNENQNLPTHVGRAYIGEDGDIVHVALNVEQDAGSRALVLHDSDGRELAKFCVSVDGSFTLEQAGSKPFRFIVCRRASGSVAMGLSVGQGKLILEARADDSAEIQFKNDNGRLILEARADDSAEFQFNNRCGTIMHALRVDAKGTFLQEGSAERPLTGG